MNSVPWIWLKNVRCCKTCLQKSSRMVSTVKLDYTEYGPSSSDDSAGTPLVILHGLYGSKANWYTLSKRLAQRLEIRVLTVDARNHGKSTHSAEMSYNLMAADLGALLSGLHINQAHVLGHSMGGRTAMTMALLQPKFLKSLIVEDSLPMTSAVSNSSQRPIIKALQSLNLEMVDGSLSKLRKRAMAALESDIPNSGIRSFLLHNLSNADKSAKATWRFNLDSIRDNLHKFTTWDDDLVKGKQYLGPTCFIGGGKSEYLPEGKFTEKEIKQIQKFFPTAEYHVISDAGHWVHSDQPGQFLEVVCHFLKSLR